MLNSPVDKKAAKRRNVTRFDVVDGGRDWSIAMADMPTGAEVVLDLHLSKFTVSGRDLSSIVG